MDEKVKKLLDASRGGRPTWNIPTSDLYARMPEDERYLDPRKVLLDDYYKGQRRTRELTHLMDERLRTAQERADKFGTEPGIQDVRYISRNDGRPARMEYTQVKADGTRLTRAEYFPASMASGAVTDPNKARNTTGFISYGAITSMSGSDKFDLITRSLQFDPRFRTGKDGKQYLAGYDHKYRSLGQNINSLLTGSNTWDDYDYERGKDYARRTTGGAVQDFNIHASNPANSARYGMSVTFGSLLNQAKPNMRKMIDAVNWFDQEFLPNNPLRDKWTGVMETRRMTANRIRKADDGSMGPAAPVAMASGLWRMNESGELVTRSFEKTKHMDLSGWSRENSAIIYDKDGRRPMRYAVASQQGRGAPIQGPQISSAYTFKRWGFMEGGAFAMSGRTFVGEHKDTDIFGMTPDQLPFGVGDTWYANNRVQQPLLGQMGGKNDFLLPPKGNAPQTTIVGMGFVPENNFTKVATMSSSDIAFQSEQKFYNIKSVTQPVSGKNAHYRAITDATGHVPDFIHPMPKPGNRSQGLAEFFWMNQSHLESPDRIQSALSVLEDVRTRSEAKGIAPTGMFSMVRDGQSFGVTHGEYGWETKVDGKRRLVSSLMKETRGSQWGNPEQVPSWHLEIAPSAVPFAEESARDYMLKHTQAVEIKDVAISDWQIQESFQQENAARLENATAAERKRLFKEWKDKEFTALRRHPKGHWVGSFEDRAGVFHHPSNAIASRSKDTGNLGPEQLIALAQLQPEMYNFISDRVQAGAFDNDAMHIMSAARITGGYDLKRPTIKFDDLDFETIEAEARASLPDGLADAIMSSGNKAQVAQYEQELGRRMLSQIALHSKDKYIDMGGGLVLPDAGTLIKYMSVSADQPGREIGMQLVNYMTGFKTNDIHVEDMKKSLFDLSQDAQIQQKAMGLDVPALAGMVTGRTGLPSDVAVVNAEDFAATLKQYKLSRKDFDAEMARFHAGDSVGIATMFPHGDRTTAFPAIRYLNADVIRGWKGFHDVEVPQGGLLVSPELVAMLDKDADGDRILAYLAPGLKDQLTQEADIASRGWGKPSQEMQGIVEKLQYRFEDFVNPKLKDLTLSAIQEQSIGGARSQAQMGRDFNAVRSIFNAVSMFDEPDQIDKSGALSKRLRKSAAHYGVGLYQLSLDMNGSGDGSIDLLSSVMYGGQMKDGQFLDVSGNVVGETPTDYAMSMFQAMVTAQMSHRRGDDEDRSLYLGDGKNSIGGQFHVGMIDAHADMITPAALLGDENVMKQVKGILTDAFNTEGKEHFHDSIGPRLLEAFGYDASTSQSQLAAVRDYVFGEGGSRSALAHAVNAGLAGRGEHVPGTDMASEAFTGKIMDAYQQVTRFMNGKDTSDPFEALQMLAAHDYTRKGLLMAERSGMFPSRTAYKDGWDQVAPGTSFTAGDGGQPEWFLNSATGEMEIIGANGPQEYVAHARGSVIPMGPNPAMAGTIPGMGSSAVPKQAAVNPQLVNRQQMKKQTQLPPGTPSLPPRIPGNGAPAVGPGGAVVMNLPGTERPGFIGLHAVTGFMRDVTGMGNLMGMVKYDPDVLQRPDFLNNIDKSWSSIDKVRGNIVGIKQYREQMAKHGYEVPGFRDFMNPQAFAEMEQFMGGKGIFRAIERFTNIEGMSRPQLEDAFKKGHKEGFVTQLPDFSKMSEKQLRGRARAVVGDLMDGQGLNSDVKQYAQWMQDNESVLTNAKLSQAVGPTPMNRNTVDAAVKSLENFNKTLEKTGKVTEMSAANARKFGEDLSHIAKQFTDMKQTYDALDMKVQTRHDSLSPAEIDTLGRLSQLDAQRFMTEMEAQLPAMQSDIAQAAERMRVRPEDDDVRQYKLRELLGRGGIAGERARHQEREFGDLYKDGLKFEVFGKEFAINDPRKIDQYGSLGRTAEGLKSAFFNYSIIAGSTISPLMKSVDPYFKSQDLMESSLGQLSVFGGNAYTEGPLAHIRQRRAQREQAGITFGESVYRSYSGFFDSAFSESLAGGLGYTASVAAPAATVGMMASSMSKNPNAGAIYGLGSAALLAGANILSGAGDVGRMTDHIANVRGGGALAALSDPLTSLSVLGGAVLNTRGFEIAKSSAEAREGFNAIFTAGGDTVTWNTAIDARARARARDEAFANATPQVLNEWIGWSGIETQEQMAARVMAEGGFDQAGFKPDARFVQGAEMDAYAVGVQSLMDNQYMNEDTAARIYTSMRGFGMDMRGFGTSTMASQIASMELQGIDGIGLAMQNSMALGQYPALDTVEGPLKSIGDFITNLAPGTSVAGVTSRISRSLEYGAQFNNLFEQASMPDYKYDWQTFASRARGTTQDTIAFQEAEAQAFGQVAQLSIADPRSGALALGGVGDYLAKSINDGSFTYSKLSQVTQQSLAAGSLFPSVAQAFPNDPNVWDKIEDLRDMTDRDAFTQAEKMLAQMAGVAEHLNPLLRASGMKEMSAPFMLENETVDQVQNRMSVYMAQAGGYQTAQQLKAANPALDNLGASLITQVDASGNPLQIGRMSQQAMTMGSVYQSALSAVPGMVPTYNTGLIGASPDAFATSMAGVQSRIGIAASANPLAFAAGLQGIGAIDIGEYTPEAANSAKIAEMMNGKAFGAIGQMALSMNQDLSGLPQGQRLSAMIDEFSGGAAIDPATLRAGYQFSSLVGQSAGLFEQYVMRNPSFNTAANLTSIMGIADMGFAPATTLQNALAGDPVAQSRAYAMSPAAPAAWNQIDLRNGLASTTFGLDDNQYSAISNFWNNESTAEGKAFFAQTNQDMRLGSWGLQNQAHQISYRAQMASYGIQAASARTGWAFTSGGYSGLDAQGFAIGGDVGKAVGHGINGGNGMGKWQIDDAMTRISREQQQYQYDRQGQELDFADKNKALQISQYMEKFDMGWNWMLKQNKYQRREMNIGRGINLTQRGWAQSDMQMERARGELEFGWQQQDFDRNIRFARGRQKIDLMREKDRSNIRFSLDQNQRDKQEDRFAEEAKWQDERFKREKEHFKETVKHNKEEMQMDKRHFLARMGLEEERMARQRQDHEREGAWMQEKWALEDQRRLIDRQEAQINYNYQMASLGVAMQAAIDMEQNRKNQDALAMGWKSVSEKFRLGFDEAIATAVDFINRLKAQFVAAGTRGDGTPEITPDRPSATGGIRKGTFTVGEFGRELVTTDTSVAVLNNRTTEAFYAGAAAAGGGGNHSDALLSEVIALLKIIAKKSPAQINATINTATGRVDLGEYLSAIETRVRT